MLPLHQDPHFTFRFADDRSIHDSTWKASKPGGGYRSSRSAPAPASGWPY
jgi:hypothetical protein